MVLLFDARLWTLSLLNFTGKKKCWVPDEKKAYVEAEITESSEGKVTVQTADGKVHNCFCLICDWHGQSCKLQNCPAFSSVAFFMKRAVNGKPQWLMPAQDRIAQEKPPRENQQWSDGWVSISHRAAGGELWRKVCNQPVLAWCPELKTQALAKFHGFFCTHSSDASYFYHLSLPPFFWYLWKHSVLHT